MNAVECRTYADSFINRAKVEMRAALKAHLLHMAQAWLTLADLYDQEQALLRAVQPAGQ